MTQYGLAIANWKITTIHSDMILGAKIIAADDDNAIADNVDTVIKQFKNDNHVMYQLVKYDGIVLSGNDNRDNIAVNVENTNKIDHLVL